MDFRLWEAHRANLKYPKEEYMFSFLMVERMQGAPGFVTAEYQSALECAWSFWGMGDPKIGQG
jgi:hypothetical protein